MKRHGFALLGLAIIAVAVWTYNVNYNTRTTLDRVSELRTRIAIERETIQVLRVEWAYLNSPDRLRELVAAHNDRLMLVPVVPEMLKLVDEAPFAPEVEDPLAAAGKGVVPIPVARPVTWRPAG